MLLKLTYLLVKKKGFSDSLEISKIVIHSKLQEHTFNLFLSMYKLPYVLLDVQLYKRRKKTEIVIIIKIVVVVVILLLLIIIKQIFKSDDTNVVPLSENN